MKILPLIICILALTIINFSQDDNEKIEQNYDRFEDKTVINVRLQLIGKDILDTNNLSVMITSRFDGKTPSLNGSSALFGFFAINKEPQYKSHSLILLVDGERIKYGEGLYNTEFNSTYLKTIETIMYMVSPDDLKKIANAKKIELRIGTKEIALKDSQLKTIKDFYSRLVP